MRDSSTIEPGPGSSVATLQAAFASGALTAVALIQRCLARIAAIDTAGPRIKAIVELNPDAAGIARQRDVERQSGNTRGALHGMPVLLKDNIATADAMRTTAGSLALAGAVRDAHIVRRLRDAGAIILGKTNLSEWANFRSRRSISGWSGRGGLTLNPYALDRNTSGSSSGSAAAIAAGLAPLAVGTETDGSIVSPASMCGLVGFKPTVGLVSRAGIVPISVSQDTAGPMCRTVADAAALLTVLAGTDADDAATVDAGNHAIDYTSALDLAALRGARIGVARAFFGRNEWVAALLESAIAVLRAQGTIVIDPVNLPNTNKYRRTELTVMAYEFRAGLNAYLSDYAREAKVGSLKEIIAFNLANAQTELQFFGQDLLLMADKTSGLEATEYLQALANNRRYARDEGLDQVLNEHRLDALIAPTSGPAWLTDFINGDAGAADFSSPAAVAGYPHVTVPAGFVHGLPVGLSFVGGAYSDARLIGFAYAFEQATLHRREPTFAASTRYIADHKRRSGKRQ